jgi:hypothetical protein
MIVIGTFQHSIELEQALHQLEQLGISGHHLLVVAMDGDKRDLGADKPSADNLKSKGVEVGFAVATGLSVIGTSVGFTLPWGPVISGLVSAIAGFCLGFGIHSLMSVKGKPSLKIKPEVIVIAQCQSDQSESVQKSMWMNRAITVGIAHASAE